jgi:hypothetical protein
MVRGDTMSIIGTRGEAPPAGKVEEIEVSSPATFKAAVGRLAELGRRTLMSWVEAIRRRMFSGRAAQAGEFDDPRSEILGSGSIQRPEQSFDAHRLVLHAAGL